MRTGAFYQDDQSIIDAEIAAFEEYKSQQIKADKAKAEQEDLRKQAERNQYSASDVWNAAFERENEIASALAYDADVTGVDNEPQEGYDVFSDIEGYEDFAQYFVGVRNPRYAMAKKNRIDREGENQKILDLHPVTGAVAMVAAGITSPSTLVSMGAPVGVGVKVVRGGMRIGATRTAAKAAAVGVPFSVAGEAALHSTQDTRTVEESSVNVMADAILGGVLGGAIVRGSPEYKSIKSALEADLASNERVMPASVLFDEDSAGARATSVAVEGGDAPATGAALKRERIVAGKFSPIAWMAKLNPQGRVLTSQNPQARAIMQELTDMNAQVVGDYTPTSMESYIQLNKAKTDELITNYENSSTASGLSPDDFQQGINDYIRYGTVSDNSEINLTAKAIQKFKDEWWQRAFEARVPGTYVTRVEKGQTVYEPISSNDAAGHLTRRFDQRAIRDDLPGFTKNVADGMKARAQQEYNDKILEAKAKVEEAREGRTGDEELVHILRADKKKNAYEVEKLNRKIGGLRLKKDRAMKANEPYDKIDAEMERLNVIRDKFKTPLDELDAVTARLKKVRAATKALNKIEAKYAVPDDFVFEQAAVDVVDKIINMRPGDNGVAMSTTSIKGRTLALDDRYVDNYLIKDMRELMNSYSNDLGAKTIMAERAGDGDVMWTAPISRVRDDYNARTQKLLNEGKQKEAEKLQREGARQVKDLEIVRDRLLGLDSPSTYNNPMARNIVSTLRTIRNWNTTTMLGGMLMSSTPELARAMAQYGLKATLKGQARAIKKLKVSLKKLPKDDLARLASISARMSINNPRMATMSDMLDEPALSTAEEMSRRITDKFMTLSGMKHFDTHMRMFSAYSMNDKMTGQILTGKTDLAMFKRFGFQDDDMTNLVSQIKTHGTKDPDGLYNMNIERWTDARTREKMEAGILREANKITTAAGVGDRPLFMSTELGRTMLQYRTFGLASINRVLIPLAQAPADQVIKGVTLPAITAALMLMGRRALQGRDPYPDEIANGDYTTPEALGFLTDIVNYAGVMAIAPDALMTLDKAYDGGYLTSTKYRNRDKWGLLLGPTAGTVSAGFNAMNFQTGADSRIRSIRKLMPYQNMFYLRPLIDMAEKAAATSAGGTGMYVD